MERWFKLTRKLRKARRVFFITLALNLAVAGGKLACGFVTGTLSMVADGFHSLLDATSNVVGIAGLTIALKPPDKGHPYGHRKFEAIGSIIISFFMFFASFEVLREAVERIVDGLQAVPQVGPVSYLVMLATMAINIGVSRYESRQGRELKVSLLVADSKHTLSDVFVSLTVIATLIAIQLHWPALDVVASILIVGFILKAGFDIIMSHLGVLVDAAVVDEEAVRELVLNVPGVTGCHKIRSRGSDDHVFVDLHVQVPAHLSIRDAHAISYRVEDELKSAWGGFVDVLVHVENEGDK